MENKINCEEYYVAFLDLLGCRSIIEKDTQDENLNNIYKIYKSWLGILGNHGSFKSIQVKIFSDNIVLAIKCKNSNAIELLLEAVSCLVQHFLECGYKVRGGITKGKLYIDDILVWGKALVDAYELENDCAKTPRIVIDKNLLVDISERTKSLMIPQNKNYKDHKDYYVLDYLKGYGTNANQQLTIISTALERVEKELEALEEESNIKEKNIYLKKYLLNSKQYWEEKANKK